MLSLADPLQRINRLLFGVFASFLLLALILKGAFPQMTVRDLGWHLAQGNWFLAHGAPLNRDVFNYPTFGQPFVNEYPFYQAVLAATHRIGGEIGLGILAAAAITAPFFLLLLPAWHGPGGRALLILALSTAALLAFNRLVLRPELVTNVCAIGWMVGLVRHRSSPGWKTFWPLLFVQILWANSHSGFILGPVLVAGFGAECVARDFFRTRRLDQALLKKWAILSLFCAGACLANPSGWARFQVPFQQQNSAMIRAYVTEMQPLLWNPGDPRVMLLLVAAGLLAAAVVLHRGRTSFAFLAIALLFFGEAFASQRHAALFAFLMAGTVFSGRNLEAGARTGFVMGLLQTAALMAGLATAGTMVKQQAAVSSPAGLREKWRAYRQHETEFPVEALEWMRQNHLQGRLLHRSEIGGWLQQSEWPPGNTFADTGYGKYTGEQVREIGLIGERPAYLQTVLEKYKPDFVVAANLSFRWPGALRQAGWHPLFYAPFGSVWAPPGALPDLRALPNEEVERMYRRWKKDHDVTRISPVLHYHNLLALHSWGLADLAANELLELPAGFRQTPLFWDTVAAVYFEEEASVSGPALDSFSRLAQEPGALAPSLVFRACLLDRSGKRKEAEGLLKSLPLSQKNNLGFFTLARIYLDQGRREEAVRLLENDDLFETVYGRRYRLLVDALEGDAVRQEEAWRKLECYAPDLL